MKPHFLALGVLLALLAAGCGAPSQPAAPAPTAAPVTSAPPVAPAPAEGPSAGAVGSVAPELRGKAWLTADGKAPDLKNKVYLVEFWSVT